jgi:hypothetical protein
MTIRRGASLAALALVSLLFRATPAAAQWFKTYDEGVRAVKDQKWAEAEQKLRQSVVEAGKEGKTPGPLVLRTSMDRRPFSPDFYLAIVFANTGRFKEADDALTLAAMRKEVKPDDPQFLAARKNVDTELARNTTPPSGPGRGPASGGGTGGGTPGGTTSAGTPSSPAPSPTPIVATPNVPGPDAATVARNQFDQAMREAQDRLSAKRFDDARTAANRARGLNVDNRRSDDLLKTIDFERSMAAAENDLQAKRFAIARGAAAQARASGVNNARADALLARIDRDGTLALAQTELDNRRFAAARAAASRAAGFGASAATVDGLMARISIGESEEAVRKALTSGDATNASGAIAALRRIDPRNAQLTAFDQSLQALVTGDAQRQALLAFYTGNYTETIRILAPLASKDAAPARVHFYLACSRAALALLGAPDNAGAGLQTARDEYRKATAADTGTLAADRRYVAPKILRALDGK